MKNCDQFQLTSMLFQIVRALKNLYYQSLFQVPGLKKSQKLFEQRDNDSLVPPSILHAKIYFTLEDLCTMCWLSMTVFEAWKLKNESGLQHDCIHVYKYV